MTGHQVNNLVADLVEMAKAVERVPQLEEQVHDLTQRNGNQSNTIAGLQVQLEASRTYAAGLEQRCHDLEVARDDAELRFLQAEEHSHLALGRLRDMQTAMGQVITTLDPPKPEPIPTPEPISVPTDGPGSGHTEGQSATRPMDTVSTITTWPSSNVHTSLHADTQEAAHTSASEGQSATDPTLVSTQADHSSTATVDTIAIPLADVPSPDEGVSVLSNPTHAEDHTGPRASVQAPAAVASADANTSSPVTPDPEPTDKWSNDWWEWHDRQLKLRSTTF